MSDESEILSRPIPRTVLNDYSLELYGVFTDGSNDSVRVRETKRDPLEWFRTLPINLKSGVWFPGGYCCTHTLKCVDTCVHITPTPPPRTSSSSRPKRRDLLCFVKVHIRYHYIKTRILTNPDRTTECGH